VPSIKHRVSNVLAWAGFTFAPIALFTVIAVGIALVPQKTPPEDCESCQILTWDDVQGSPNLQRKQTQAGDWVLDNRKLIRSRPLWVINAKDFIDDFANEYEDLFLPHASLWLLAALINYVMVGSLRILPWRKIDEGEQ
jgi:hypothetical protein